MVVGDNFPPNPGGIGSLMYSLAECSPFGNKVVLTSVKKPLRGNNYMTRISTITEDISKCRQIFEAVRLAIWSLVVFRPRLILLDSIWRGNIGILLRKFRKIPILVFAHGNEVAKLDGSVWEGPRRALLKVDKIMANSGYTRDLLLARGVESRRIEVVYPGADTSMFYPVGAEKIKALKEKYGIAGRRVILTVANLHRVKGHDTVLRVLPGIIEEMPDLLYLIVGKGRDEQYLKDLTRDLKLDHNVKFMEFTPDRNILREIYNLCEVMVMVSRPVEREPAGEGFGIAFLEANACGKPVIAGRGGGMPEAVVENQTGLLVDAENELEVQGALRTILRDKQLARRLGEAGRRRVREELSCRQAAEKVFNIAVDLLKQQPLRS